MKKVLLVNTNTEKSPYPVPPVGLALLASKLEARFEVRIFDGMFRSGERLKEEIRAFGPDYIGVGIRNIDDVVMERTTYYLDKIKSEFMLPIREESQAVTILGGGGFSIFPRQILQMFGGDYGIVGEGEQSFMALLAALESGRDPLEIPGVITKEGQSAMTCNRLPAASPLTIPESRIDRFIDYAPYRERGSYPIQTKRGCHYRCIYCSYPFLEGRQYRLRAKKEIVDEMESVLDRLGDVSFEFVDSTFNAPSGHAEDLCEEIIRRGLHVRLRTMGVNPGRITDDLLRLMKKAGFSQIDCTPDSASPTMLRSLAKNFDRAQLERAAQTIRAHRMPTMWFFLLGGPGETEDTLGETFDFVDRFVDGLDMVHLTLGIRIFPGTPLFERARSEGVLPTGEVSTKPVFYVSAALGETRLRQIVHDACQRRPNCVPGTESSPDREMLGRAAQLRQRLCTDEPMFRTLLRIRRERMGFKSVS